ncbi:MAG TPA: ribonuclease P protein component [Geobacteraceae bacterium]
MIGSASDYPKDERLRSRSEYLHLAAHGRTLHTSNFIFVWFERPGSGRRLGITVSRKVGGAVVRNRIKRLLREYYRLHKELFPAADCNIIAKRGAAAITMAALCQELDRTLHRLRA